MVRVSNMKNTCIIKKHYTIVELLLVILVIGIILGIGVAGVDRAMRGSGVTGAIRNIGGRLNVARSFAVTSNQKVAVVFPMIVRMRYKKKDNSLSNEIADPLDETDLFIAPSDSYSPAEEEAIKNSMRNKYLFRSLRVCVVTWNATDLQYRFVRWCENDGWTFLPSGTYCNFYFDETDVSQSPALLYGVDMSPDGKKNNDGIVDIPANSDDAPPYGMAGIVYSAGGALDSQMGTPNIKIVAFEDKFNANVGTASNKGSFMVRGIEPKSANSKVDKGWSYTLNPFTGLGTYEQTKAKAHD